jgi:outer membrane protein assembly factor BamB
MTRNVYHVRKLVLTIGSSALLIALTIAGVRAAQKDADAKSADAKTADAKSADAKSADAKSADSATEKTADSAAVPDKANPAYNSEKSPINAAASEIQPLDWNQWGGSSLRNNTPTAKNMPTDWDVGKFDDETGAWKGKSTARNIKWAARLGSKANGNPVVANGKAFVGTNNGSAYLKRYPSSVDLGVLLCFDTADGKFLWQDSSEKLIGGRVNDWPEEGVCSAPLVEGHRLWYVTNRGEVKCLDIDKRKAGTTDEPAVIWTLNMMKTLGVLQHNMANCSVTDAGDILFVNTSNGVDEAHIKVPSPSAPSFIALDKNTGKIFWTDNSPGKNILHGQWSSPSYAILGGVPQVIFGAGDGWVYSFLGTKENVDGHPKLLWKFDCNPKESKYVLGGQSTRNHIIGTPMIYKGLVYVGVGEDPEHGEGNGHFWCIDPTKRGDVSSELAFNLNDMKHPIPHHRNQAVVAANGEVARPNPNSAAVWHYTGNGKTDPTSIMHRTIGTATIKDDLLFIADFTGIFHCLDAKTGKPHWTYDMLAASWGSALIADDKVYIGNEDGYIFAFRLSPKMELLSKDSDGKPGGISMGAAIYSSPIAADNVLYVSTRNYLFAIQSPPQVAER